MRETGPARIQRRLALAALLACGACSTPGNGDGVPSAAPDFTGKVAMVNMPSVLLVADEVQPAGADRASMRVDRSTRVLQADGRIATAAQLHEGQWVRAWIRGPVRESYPVQADARVLVLE